MSSPEIEYRLVPLTQNQFAKVSPHRFEELNRVKWCAAWDPNTQSFYAVRGKPQVKMHREILGLKRGDRRTGDHDNHDTLDNTDDNLRIANHAQQAWNRRRNSVNTTGFKGVKRRYAGHYFAEIKVHGRKIYLGRRSTAEAAYRELYVPAALKYHGEFACFA